LAGGAATGSTDPIIARTLQQGECDVDHPPKSLLGIG
jgi:hypothetical protein